MIAAMTSVEATALHGGRRGARLVVVALCAGLFSGLFGVGGGIVIVSLLILMLGYEAHEAAGTSLAAIVLIAGAAALTQHAYGNLHVGTSLQIGLPAVAGVLIGIAAQQRVSSALLRPIFALLLVASGVLLVVHG